MPLRLLRRVLLTSALAVTFLLCLPSLARAQGITVAQEQSLPRIDRDGKSILKRPLALKPEGVNFQDCLDDQRIRFSLILSGVEGNGSLQVWAGLGGADCKTQTNRTGVAATCWQLVTGIPLQATTSVDIPVRAIMSGAPPNTPVAPVANQDVCGKIDLAQISVQFLYFAPGQLATPAQHKDVAVEVDTIGPAPPSGLRSKPGNTQIRVEWDNISGEGGLSVLTGVRVYCDPVTGSTAPATTDAAAADSTPATTEPADASCTEVPNDAGDSGLDAGTTTVCEDAGTSTTTDAGTSVVPATGSTCASANLSAGVIPDQAFNDKFSCGSITGNSGSTVVANELAGQPLQNNTTYAVSVAATDAFNNVGPLSTPICQYPEITNDFWENYVNAGGDAGGGLCTTSSPGAPVGSLSALAALGIAVLSSLRRRWSRDSLRKDR